MLRKNDLFDWRNRNGYKKNIFAGFLILLLIVSALLMGFNKQLEKPTINLIERSANENFDDISLTIYYTNPFDRSRHAWSAEFLMGIVEKRKIVITGGALEEHIDLFKRISSDDVIPVRKKTYLNARLYYVLESKRNGKLFDVAMWGGNNNSIFVNGFEVKENDIFYDVVKPFLPEDAVKDLENYVAGIWPES